MKNLFFDENYNVSDFTFILSNRNYDHLGEIVNIEWESINYNAPLQSAKEISFTVFKELNGHTEKLWNQIKDLKLVWVKEIDEYFEIRVSINDSSSCVQKVITGTSLCEAELSQTLIENLEINTVDDIEREDYDPEHPTVFYNPDNPTCSLLNRVLSKNPNYHIGYVSPTLYDIVRQFSISEKNVYDFMVTELAKEIQCMFQFDSTTRTISVYDLNEERNPNGYGEDTSVYIDVENLSDEIKFETNVDSIKNCFRLKAGDDTITAAIRAINPTGSNCIYYFSQEQKQDMPSELVDKIEEYEKLCAELKPEYISLTSNLYDTIDNIIYYTSGMMPEIPSVEITAKTEADKLTVKNLNPIAVSKFENQLIPSETTVNSAVLNYAKSIIRTGYVKLTIDHSNYVYNETDGIKTGTWTGSFKVENYSNKDDIVITSDISLSITGNSDEYIKQRMLKTISSNDDEDHSLSAIINKTNEQFTVEINKYCKSRVQSFYDAINEGINVLVQTSFAQSSNDSDSAYQTIYLPLYEKSNLCLLRLKELDETISAYENEKISIENRIKEIQNTLDFEKKLGDLYPLFCSYRREQVYQNDNYISDGLDNSQVLEKAQEFISIAEKELIKSGEFQHSISATLYNLMLLPEFKNILKKLDLGNWIRVGVDGNVYKLRFIRYSINCSNTDNIEVEFTDIIKDKSDSVSDLHSLLSVTQNMSSTYDYVSRQSSSGNNAFVQINQMYRNGLNSALMRIKNNDNEEVVCNNLGIMAREYDDIEEKYSPEQIRVTHNAIVMTEDNWKSASLAIGKNEYYKFEENEKGEKVLVTRNGYGVVAKFLNAPYVTGGQIIGGDIYSSNYNDTGNIQTSSGSYIDLENGHLWLGAGRLVWDGNEFHIYDMYGNDLYTRVERNASGIEAEVKRATGAETGLSNRISATDSKFSVKIEEIQKEIDGEIVTYNVSHVPTLLNYPAWDFTYNIPCNGTVACAEVPMIYNDEYYSRNARSVVFNEVTSMSYRFTKGENGEWYWRDIGDTDFGIAMQKISELEITTDSISTTVEQNQIYNNQQISSLSSRITQTAESITSEVNRATQAEGTLSSRITQNADEIKLRVRKGNISSEISQEAGKISIKSNRFSLESTNCTISEDGTIKATNAELSGKIISSSGKIGGFDISSDNIHFGRDTLESAQLGIYIGNDGISLASEILSGSFAETKISGGMVSSHFGDFFDLTSKNINTSNIKASDVNTVSVETNSMKLGGRTVSNFLRTVFSYAPSISPVYINNNLYYVFSASPSFDTRDFYGAY